MKTEKIQLDAGKIYQIEVRGTKIGHFMLNTLNINRGSHDYGTFLAMGSSKIEATFTEIPTPRKKGKKKSDE